MSRPGMMLVLAATRPQFLTASVLPVLIGTAWGWSSAGELDEIAAGLALLATVLVHAASNVYNDVSDEIHGTDRANTAAIRPFTGGSGFIQEGVIALPVMQRIAVWLAALAIGTGVLLALRHGPGVVLFGMAGGALGAAYSLPGLRLSGRGLGEAAIAAAFGILPVTGAAWLQTGALDADALLVSLPVSAWAAAIILANEIPDAASDCATGKHTLAVRLGTRTTALYAALQLGAALTWVALVARGLLPAWTLAGPAALLVPAMTAASALSGGRAELERGIRKTLLVHAAGSLMLVAAILLKVATALS